MGNWFYFRFWEPRYAESYFASLAEHPDKLHAWFMTVSCKLDSICIGRGENFTIFAYAGPAMPRGRPKRPFRYEAPERAAHVHAKRTDFIRRLCQRTIVLYRGEIVEDRPTAGLFADPQAAYTRELLDAIPLPDPAQAWA